MSEPKGRRAIDWLACIWLMLAIGASPMIGGCAANKSLRSDRYKLVSATSDPPIKKLETEPQNGATQVVLASSHAAVSEAVPVAISMDGEAPSKPETANATSEWYPLALNQVVYSAIREHPTIRAQWESTIQARAEAITASLLPNPQLFTDGQLLPLTQPFTVTRQGGPPQQDVILTYPIDWFVFGKRLAAMQTAHAGIHVAQFDYEDMIRNRIVEATDAFYTLVAAQQLEKISAEVVENFEKLEKITEQAVKDGGKPAVELHRIRLDLLSAKQHQMSLKADRKVAQSKVASLMGRSDLSQSVYGEFDFDQPLQSSQLDRESAFQLATETRADLQKLRWLATQSSQNILLQQRLAKPTLAPSLGYTRQYQEKAIGFPDANSWSAALNMSVPLHDRNQGNISRSFSAQRRVLFQIEALRIDIREEVEATFAQLEASESAARSVADEQLQLASQVRESIIRSFESGGRPLIDVLDAQKSYRDTLSLYYSTRTNYWKSLYRLYGVVGQQPPVLTSSP